MNVWDIIAPSWYGYRHKPEKIAIKLSKEWKPGRILDIGCSNCRNLLPFTKFTKYGIDSSKEMIKFSKKYTKKYNFKVKLKQASAEKLPFKDNSFDYVLCLAVLHHAKKREKAIQEIYRILKPEGKAVITVWNKLQKKFLFKPKETFIPWGRHKRYYYFFGYFELRKLLKKTGFKIIKSKFFGKNIIFYIQKV